MYMVIHKSLRNFRPLQYSNRDGHAEGEHDNRRRGTLIFYSTLQPLDISTFGDGADVNSVIKFLPHKCNVCGRLTAAASPGVAISSTCKVGQKLGVSLPLLTCSQSVWPSRLQYRRGRKSLTNLWITLYIKPDDGPSGRNMQCFKQDIVIQSISSCVRFYSHSLNTYATLLLTIFVVLTELPTQIALFWNVTPCTTA